MIDVHCHILPYVDDGAENMDEALDLLFMEAAQGVSEICLTPHLRSGMFTSSDEKVILQFERLKQRVNTEGIPIQLFLSREYFYDTAFLEILEQKTALAMGSRNVVLVEFHYSVSSDTLLSAAQHIRQTGYQPLFAHLERYECIQNQPSIALDLINTGTMIQVNADSILGLEGRKKKNTSHWLLKNHCVFIVASDAHDTRFRVPHLKKCETCLDRLIGREYRTQLLYRNPLLLLH